MLPKRRWQGRRWRLAARTLCAHFAPSTACQASVSPSLLCLTRSPYSSHRRPSFLQPLPADVRALPAAEIQRRVKSGEVVPTKVERLLFCYTGATMSAVDSSHPAGDCVIDSVDAVPWVRQAPVLVMEMTYIEHHVCVRMPAVHSPTAVVPRARPYSAA